MNHFFNINHEKNNTYPIELSLYKLITDEGIVFNYSLTSNNNNYSLMFCRNGDSIIFLPSDCLEKNSWLEIQWSIAHEFGHYLNLKSNCNTNDILENERLAWERGEEVLKECGISFFAQDNSWKISKSFYEEMGRCLSSYRIGTWNVMKDGTTIDKVKHVCKKIFSFIVNGLIFFCSIIGILGIFAEPEERILLFSPTMLFSLFILLIIFYVISLTCAKCFNLFHN